MLFHLYEVLLHTLSIATIHCTAYLSLKMHIRLLVCLPDLLLARIHVSPTLSYLYRHSRTEMAPKGNRFRLALLRVPSLWTFTAGMLPARSRKEHFASDFYCSKTDHVRGTLLSPDRLLPCLEPGYSSSLMEMIPLRTNHARNRSASWLKIWESIHPQHSAVYGDAEPLAQ